MKSWVDWSRDAESIWRQVRAFERHIAFSCGSTITNCTRFSRTSHYAMNTQHFDRAN